MERGVDALAAFFHGFIGQPHGDEGGGAAADLDLNIDAPGFQPEKGDGSYMRDHGFP